MIKRLLIIGFTIGAIVCAVWVIVIPSFESVVGLITAITALIGALVIEKPKKQYPQQNQTVSNSSTGIQAGRDVNISGDKNVK